MQTVLETLYFLLVDIGLVYYACELLKDELADEVLEDESIDRHRVPPDGFKEVLYRFY